MILILVVESIVSSFEAHPLLLFLFLLPDIVTNFGNFFSETHPDMVCRCFWGDFLRLEHDRDQVILYADPLNDHNGQLGALP